MTKPTKAELIAQIAAAQGVQIAAAKQIPRFLDGTPKNLADRLAEAEAAYDFERDELDTAFALRPENMEAKREIIRLRAAVEKEEREAAAAAAAAKRAEARGAYEAQQERQAAEAKAAESKRRQDAIDLFVETGGKSPMPTEAP